MLKNHDILGKCSENTVLEKYDRRGGQGKAAENGITAKGRFDASIPLFLCEALVDNNVI